MSLVVHVVVLTTLVLRTTEVTEDCVMVMKVFDYHCACMIATTVVSSLPLLESLNGISNSGITDGIAPIVGN